MDLRLWRQLNTTKQLVAGLALGGALTGLLIVFQALFLARIVSGVYIGHAQWHVVWPFSLMLLAIIALRSLVAGFQESWALRFSAESQTRLRHQFIHFLLHEGGGSETRPDSGALVTLAVQGIDDFEVFLARYLPQIVITALVPAIVWLGVVSRDWLSGLILLITLPLIPLFMILIGRQAENHSQRQIQLMNRLSGHFLDVLHGLDTLKLFGRSQEQSKTIYRQSEAFRATTMATLRIAFLSGMVLELIASLSMAFIAVAVGLRLIHGQIPFETAFMVLVLIPEFYIPWRGLGAKFHDGLKGASAAKEIFELMESPLPALQGGHVQLPQSGPWSLEWRSVSFTYPSRTLPALEDITLALQPGQRLAIVGPSGSGKSTLIQLLMGTYSFSGEIRVGGTPLSELDLNWWRRQLSWVTQRPYLFDGTILDNLRQVASDASTSQMQQALVHSGAWEFISQWHDGWDTQIGQEGVRLSGGQRQRLALARAFLLDTPVVVFDEPTQNLDLASEQALLDAMERLSKGRTVITIAHRLSTVTRADRLLVLQQGRMAQWGSPEELLRKPGLYRALVDAYQGRETAHAPLQADQVL